MAGIRGGAVALIFILFFFYEVQAERGFATDEVSFLSLSIMGMYHRIFGGGIGGGGLKKGGNIPRATESQRCKSSASR